MPTYPSELNTPYVLDYNNAITQALLSSGVGIYFSDDNLTTVINYYDNSAGTATDITNNELGRVGDFRIGVDITGLTPAQQASVQDDPYQLFESVVDIRANFGYMVASVPGVALTIPRQIFNSTSHFYEIKFVNYGFTGNNGQRFDIAFASNFGTDLRVSNVNTLSWSGVRVSSVELDGVSIPTGTAMPLDGLMHTLRVYTTTTTGWLEGLFNNGGTPFSIQVMELRVLSTTGLRLWTFDRSAGTTTVNDEYANATATINGGVFEEIIEVQSFDTGDYATLALLNSSENARDYQVNYTVNTSISGGSLSGFANGIDITTNNASQITSAMTLTTTGFANIHDITVDDVNAVGASDVYLNNCEAQDVTG